jgi:hypothetical protein
MLVKPGPSLDNWSKALLKACEAQSVLVNPGFANENQWEADCRRGMNALKERCDKAIPPDIIFIDVNSVVSDISSRLALRQTGVKMTQFSKSAALWTMLSGRTD